MPAGVLKLMHVKKRRNRKGPRRDRSLTRLAFEAGMDYQLSLMRLPGDKRAKYSGSLACRGFDVPSRDTRARPAPRPKLTRKATQQQVRAGEEGKNREKGRGSRW